MLQESLRYKNNFLLKEFIENKNLKESKNILCQIFTANTQKSFIEKLCKTLNNLIPNINIIGTTTDGEIRNGKISINETIISFTTFEKSKLQTYITNDFKDFEEAGKKLSKNLYKKDLKLIITFIDGINGNGENYLKGISSINKDVKIAGGLSADNGNFKTTYIFSNDKIYDFGVVGVGIYSDELNVISDYNFNWHPIGKDLKITKCEGSKVISIDDRSALDTYKYYLGDNIAKELPSIGVEFPLVIKRNGIDIARAILKNNNDGSLSFGGNFKVGDTVKLSYGDTQSILNSSQNNLNKFENKNIEAIFLYSCMARRRFLKSSGEEETIPFNHIAPNCGFFSYGEFYTNSSPEFLNQTMTILALSESSTNTNKVSKAKVKNKETTNSTLKALSNLIHVTTKELEEQKDKAIKASEVKDKFLANMSHELKTPLNSINIISNVMMRNSKKDLKDIHIKNLSIINKSGNFLLHMINDILDMSKLEAGNMIINIEKTNIKNTSKEMIEMFYPQFENKDIKLLYKFDETLNYVFTDEIRVKQILKNLISNSLKFTKEGYVKVNIEDNNNFFKIIVEDQGIGIAKEKINMVFDRFKQAENTTSKDYGGTGLGLAIIKEIVSLLNGTINISSELNKGTVVEINLPKNSKFDKHLNFLDLNKKEKTVSKKEIIKNQKKEKIIILNNNPIVLFDLIIKLQKDFEVIQCFEENELIKKYENSKTNIKVIVDISNINSIFKEKFIDIISKDLIIIYENTISNQLKDKAFKVIKKPIIQQHILSIKDDINDEYK